MSEKWSQRGEEWWIDGGPVPDTDGERYFKFRNIGLVPGPEVFRFHPAVEHPKLRKKFPALIARITGSDEPSHQFTFLAPGGKGKAAIEKNQQRRTFGASKGGAIRFAEPIEGQPLLIGEGSETVATAIDASGYSGWACLGTSGLGSLVFPPEVKIIIMLAENDGNGANEKALAKVCPVLVGQGITVKVAYPSAGCVDFNDVVCRDGVDRNSGLMIVKMAIEAAQDWQPKRGKAAKPKSAAASSSSQASFLFDLAALRCELFCDSHDEAYASFLIGEDQQQHRETHKLKSRGFSQWLRLSFYAERHGAPSSEAMSSAVKTIAAKAHHDGVRHEVYLRTVSLDGKVYIDRCDEHWTAIEIDADGYRVIEDPPVYFRREPGMLALPVPSTIDPKKGLKRLEELLRLRDRGDFVIIVAWLLAILVARSPYAIIAFIGEPGSTKTSSAYAVRSLIDPNIAPLRSRPKEIHEVFVAAIHSHIVAYNNLSSLPDWLSDVMCVITEGSGESRRELFTDADEALLYAKAPFLLTSVENVVRLGDLAQRTLLVHLASVPDGERLTEDEFKAKFARAHADILGGLCGAAAYGLGAEKALKLKSLPRLATFYRWAIACEGALWLKGTFAAAFDSNAKSAVEDVVEADKAAFILRLFMADKGEWEGTATQLLGDLVGFIRRPLREAEAEHARVMRQGKWGDAAEQERAAAKVRDAREKARDMLGEGWPKLPHYLAGRLKRASPALRKSGINVEWVFRHGGVKIMRVTTRAMCF
jgi:hypothetical protein